MRTRLAKSTLQTRRRLHLRRRLRLHLRRPLTRLCHRRRHDSPRRRLIRRRHQTLQPAPLQEKLYNNLDSLRVAVEAATTGSLA